MRSSRALHALLRYKSPSLSCALARTTHLTTKRRLYCSSCESSVPTKPKPSPSTSTPPPPDHRQLAIEQELFTTSKYSPGSTLFLPNGARIFNKLTAFLRAQYINFGFEEVITPTIYKKSLWEKSGHWHNYADDMFSVTGRGARALEKEEHREIGEEEEYGLKPMNCPGHCLLFGLQGGSRSFRDMPVRYADFSPLHRNEISGALSGLTRVRRFHQDDAHIFCRPCQVGEEIFKTLEFVKIAYKAFRLGSYKLVLSTRPQENFIGTVEEWERAEDALRKALDESGQEWTMNEGDGAFYGPKIDIILSDSDGKEHQTATIQLDFQLPKRFDLAYVAPAPELEQKGLTTTDPELLAVNGSVTPVIIHRAILGSVERFMALLIEHYNGRWPFWLSPRQVIILTVNNDEKVVNYARLVKSKITSIPATYNIDGAPQTGTQEIPIRSLYQSDIRVDIDESPKTLHKRVREAKLKRYNIILTVGARDLENETVYVDFGQHLNDDVVKGSDVGAGSKGQSMPLDDVKKFLEELERRFY